MPKESIVRVLHRKRQRKLGVLVKVSVAIVLTVFSIFVCYPKYLQALDLKARCSSLESEIAEKKGIQEELTQEKDRLTQDPEAIEEAARRHLEMCRPGERVYRIVPNEEAHDVAKGGGEQP